MHAPSSPSGRQPPIQDGRLARDSCSSNRSLLIPTLLEAPFTAQGFPVGIPTGGTLTFTSNDLAHALFTTGRAPCDQARHGSASLWEFIHRASLVPAYLRRTSTRAIHKSALARDLDRSEKVGLSYALGQAMTAIYCRQQLGVDFLMHVDRYATRHGVTFGLGRKRPDLFGMTLPGDWIVAEAKGRSNGMESGLPAQLAGQKSMIKSINGTKPTVALGCVTSFPVLYSGVWDRLRVDVVDPRSEREAVDIVVDLDLFWRAYYEPFALAANAGEQVDDLPGYVVSRFPGLDLQVGLRTPVLELIVGDEPITSDLLRPALAESVSDDRQDRFSFPDGTLVETSWAEAHRPGLRRLVEQVGPLVGEQFHELVSRIGRGGRQHVEDDRVLVDAHNPSESHELAVGDEGGCSGAVGLLDLVTPNAGSPTS